jgi:hypothetical protein
MLGRIVKCGLVVVKGAVGRNEKIVAELNSGKRGDSRSIANFAPQKSAANRRSAARAKKANG